MKMRRPRRDEQDFDAEPVDSRSFWQRANAACSDREIAILTQRAAGMEWRTIATLHGVSERHTRRVWNEAIERTAGTRPPHTRSAA